MTGWPVAVRARPRSAAPAASRTYFRSFFLRVLRPTERMESKWLAEAPRSKPLAWMAHEDQYVFIAWTFRLSGFRSRTPGPPPFASIQFDARRFQRATDS